MAKPLGFSGFGVMHGQLIQWGSRVLFQEDEYKTSKPNSTCIASVGRTGVEQVGFKI